MRTRSLVRLAQGGDEVAFRALFRATQPAVLRYLSVVAASAAEDLAGDTWVCVVRDLHRFVGDDDGFRAWVLSIARSRWYDHLRRQGRRPEELCDTVPEGRGYEPAAETVAIDVVTTELALATLRTLPLRQAEVVYLRHVADLDVATTARLLDMSEGAVRVTALRGLRALAEVLRERGVTPAAPPAVDQVS